MNFSSFIGIDVSKLTFDAHVHSSKQKKEYNITIHEQNISFSWNTSKLVLRTKLRKTALDFLSFNLLYQTSDFKPLTSYRFRIRSTDKQYIPETKKVLWTLSIVWIKRSLGLLQER